MLQPLLIAKLIQLDLTFLDDTRRAHAPVDRLIEARVDIT